MPEGAGVLWFCSMSISEFGPLGVAFSFWVTPAEVVADCEIVCDCVSGFKAFGSHAPLDVALRTTLAPEAESCLIEIT